MEDFADGYTNVFYDLAENPRYKKMQERLDSLRGANDEGSYRYKLRSETLKEMLTKRPRKKQETEKLSKVVKEDLIPAVATMKEVTVVAADSLDFQPRSKSS